MAKTLDGLQGDQGSISTTVDFKISTHCRVEYIVEWDMSNSVPFVICLMVFHPISSFQFLTSKLKSSYILVVHNDHVVDLVNSTNVFTSWLGWFGYVGLHVY
jgi:hypothetical protein